MDHVRSAVRKLVASKDIEIEASKHALKEIEVVELVRRQRADCRQELVFSARPFVLCGMPLKRPPPEQLVHRRRNGRFFLQIHGHSEYGLPFGQDRLAVIWAATLAVRQNSRIIEFESGSEILQTFGLNRNGLSYRRLIDGFKRVFGSTIYFGLGDDSCSREVFDCARFSFFDRMRLWTSRMEPREPVSTPTNHIELSQGFWEEVQAHPVPSELHAVRGFVNSPGCLDFYLWLIWRCYGARREERIPLFGPSGLQHQLGSEEYGRERDFRRTIERWLTSVRTYWPDCPAKLAATSQAIYLHPSTAIHRKPLNSAKFPR